MNAAIINCRRIAFYKRFLVMAAAAVLLLFVYYHISPRFLPDEAIDAQLADYIRRNFQLPSTQAPISRAPVRRVHFMHKSHLILPDYKPYVSSWRRVYPNYELYFWTDADIERLVDAKYPKLARFYRDQLSNPLERSDFARVLIIHAFGGWYADLDAGSLISAENLTENHSLIIPMEPYTHAMVLFGRRRLINNAIMYSSAGHPYWMYYVNKMATVVGQLTVSSRTNDDAVFTTGPVIMTRAMEQFARANSDRCGGGVGRGGDFWCPYVPGPRQFSPLIDATSRWLARWASVMCPLVFGEAEISRECARLRRSGFENRMPPDAFTYHAFLHLTGARRSAAKVNVSDWGLSMRLSPLTYLA